MGVKVSVIIPVYNEEEYIAECLESVIRQTLKEIEVICVDDGSTDHSVQIVEKYCSQYSWIRLLKQENQGAGVARNYALSQAKGQFVCFLDADDYYISGDALETLYDTAVEEKVNICAGLVQTEFEGKIEKDPILRNILMGKDKVCVFYQDFQFDYQYTCYLYNRDFLREYNISFPEYRRFQDPPFLVQALFYAHKFVVVRTELYFYRRGFQKPEFTNKKTFDLFEGLLFNLKFAREHGLEKLFGITLSRINHDYFDILYGGLERHIQYLKERFMEADQLVKETNLFIEPLELYLLKEERERSNELFRKIKTKIDKNADMIIYGAGDLGKKCVLYLENTGYANIKMWVDHYKQGTVCYEKHLHGLQEMPLAGYDKILIAVRDRAVSNEIKQELMKWDVVENKIIEWCDK